MDVSPIYENSAFVYSSSFWNLDDFCFSGGSQKEFFIIIFTFTFMHLAEAFIQSDLQCILAIHLYCQYINVRAAHFHTLSVNVDHENLEYSPWVLWTSMYTFWTMSTLWSPYTLKWKRAAWTFFKMSPFMFHYVPHVDGHDLEMTWGWVTD